MTIAISLKVNDGVVLAADSASTLIGQVAGGTGVVNIYNNANKVFNLRKGLPIGMITWGSGSIGNASISTLAKDLRRRFAGEDNAAADWKLDPQTYQLSDVIARVRQFMFDDHYVGAFAAWPNKPALGFLVAGYSANSDMAEEYRIDIQNGQCLPPTLVRQKPECGVNWNGEPEAIHRLILGYSTALPGVLKERLGVPDEQLGAMIATLGQVLQAPLVMPPMPIQDAIDLAEFLVQLTVQFSRFSPGAPTVGGPIEIAAITKHEGFRWVRRKHYFSAEYNSPMEAL